MLTVSQCRVKIARIDRAILRQPKKSRGDFEYIKHLERLKEAYQVELMKALGREKWIN